MAFKLSAKQSSAWKRLEDKTTNEIMYGGAAGGGKSFLGAIWHIYRRTHYPGSRGLIGRSKLKSLKESTMVTLFDALALMGYESKVDFNYNQQENTITWANGSKTIFKDLFAYPSDPDFQSLGSTEFTDVFIDEATEISLKAFDIIKSRIRYKLGEFDLVPKIYITGNPQPGWVKDRFVQDDQGRPIKLKCEQAYIQATIFDNPDKQFVALYAKQLEDLSSDYDRARLLHGDWDAEREILSPFLIGYDESKHVGETKLNRNAQALVLIDFNVNPFSASIFNTWFDGQPHLHQVAEIEIYNGTIEKMGDAIKSILGDGIYSTSFGGDFMGTHQKVGARDNKSLFDELQLYLGVSKQQFVLKPNPTHKKSREQCAYFLQNFPDLKIGEHCKGSRRDYRVVQVDKFGSIIKQNRKDTSQLADFLDNFRYCINTHFGVSIDNHKRTGRWT